MNRPLTGAPDAGNPARPVRREGRGSIPRSYPYRLFKGTGRARSAEHSLLGERAGVRAGFCSDSIFTAQGSRRVRERAAAGDSRAPITGQISFAIHHSQMVMCKGPQGFGVRQPSRALDSRRWREQARLT
jgi:hypothetical protein